MKSPPEHTQTAFDEALYGALRAQILLDQHPSNIIGLSYAKAQFNTFLSTKNSAIGSLSAADTLLLDLANVQSLGRDIHSSHQTLDSLSEIIVEPDVYATRAFKWGRKLVENPHLYASTHPFGGRYAQFSFSDRHIEQTSESFKASTNPMEPSKIEPVASKSIFQGSEPLELLPLKEFMKRLLKATAPMALHAKHNTKEDFQKSIPLLNHLQHGLVSYFCSLHQYLHLLSIDGKEDKEKTTAKLDVLYAFCTAFPKISKSIFPALQLEPLRTAVDVRTRGHQEKMSTQTLSRDIGGLFVALERRLSTHWVYTSLSWRSQLLGACARMHKMLTNSQTSAQPIQMQLSESIRDRLHLDFTATRTIESDSYLTHIFTLIKRHISNPEHFLSTHAALTAQSSPLFPDRPVSANNPLFLHSGQPPSPQPHLNLAQSVPRLIPDGYAPSQADLTLNSNKDPRSRHIAALFHFIARGSAYRLGLLEYSMDACAIDQFETFPHPHVARARGLQLNSDAAVFSEHLLELAVHRTLPRFAQTLSLAGHPLEPVYQTVKEKVSVPSRGDVLNALISSSAPLIGCHLLSPSVSQLEKIGYALSPYVWKSVHKGPAAVLKEDLLHWVDQIQIQDVPGLLAEFTTQSVLPPQAKNQTGSFELHQAHVCAVASVLTQWMESAYLKEPQIYKEAFIQSLSWCQFLHALAPLHPYARYVDNKRHPIQAFHAAYCVGKNPKDTDWSVYGAPLELYAHLKATPHLAPYFSNEPISFPSAPYFLKPSGDLSNSSIAHQLVDAGLTEPQQKRALAAQMELMPFLLPAQHSHLLFCSGIQSVGLSVLINRAPVEITNELLEQSALDSLGSLSLKEPQALYALKEHFDLLLHLRAHNQLKPQHRTNLTDAVDGTESLTPTAVKMALSRRL